MMRLDMMRFKKGLLLTNRDELLQLAQDSESFLLEFETEMRAAGLTPDARQTENNQTTPPLYKPSHRLLEDRRGGVRDIRDRLGMKPIPTQDMRECNHCKQIGHIARQCPDLPSTFLPPPPPTRPTATRVDDLAAHKTDGAVCSTCKKPGHVEAQR